ncbi:MAG: hypothetical protein K6G07_01410 [Lachnospiraceae bacterium]|nr:hypothetical protein [Lachnospiraceae bacterium]
MEENKDYIIGVELGPIYTQVSYVTFNGGEGDCLDIPTVACKRSGVNQWYVGQEAMENFQARKGVLVRNILQAAIHGEMIRVEERSIDPVELLGLFLRGCFSQVGIYRPGLNVKAAVITVDHFDKHMVDLLTKVKEQSMTEFEHVFFVPKEESLYYYAVHQPKEMFSYMLEVMDMSAGYLSLKKVEMTKRGYPIPVKVETEDHTEILYPTEMEPEDEQEILEDLDEQMNECMLLDLEGRIVTTIYLTGQPFEKEWCEKTLKTVCRSRKVYGGNNLFSRGACLAAMDKLSVSNEREFIYMGKEKIKSDIGVIRLEDGKEVISVLWDGMQNWYDAKAEFDFMPGEDAHLPIVILPLDKSQKRVVPVVLPADSQRDMKGRKFHCTMSMRSEKEVSVQVQEVPFGEFYKEHGRVYEEIITLGIL